ncbi:DUF438 domain-containing protein [Porphyromonas cangingivalis]|uniref:Hemerythrin n=1 Tax=Porphyromonas cangingivalis TaxID=36874 RepID=A0A1T4LVI5_PORCN|nr:DUF438 domain-containing protein [Porphyromonas cangingivalis]SJZ58695.1 hypothetical protein SAMN02745205_01283 [Porphyromonas cangingivalis]VEJ01959.1 Uncharacterized conserved protein [Porphyromonas cangingivalis]
MSEYINNASRRKEELRELLLQIHNGEQADAVRDRLIERLRSIPYNEVVEVEQELINDKLLTEEEILSFCDLHTAVLDGSIDLEGAKPVPAGHPVDTFKKENSAIRLQIKDFYALVEAVKGISDNQVPGYLMQLRTILNNFWDVDKHYKRKEYLLFPYLEKHHITGPPKVLWGKHDETRAQLKASVEVLKAGISTADAFRDALTSTIAPAVEMIEGMIMKEEEILFPMSMDVLSDEEWYKVYQETPEFGYTLIDPEDEWRPEGVDSTSESAAVNAHSGAIRLSSGNFNIEELEALFIHLPIDITFVDKDDKVRFFSHSPKRVFERNRSIIGRDVRMCHPPGSVHIVEQILEDFKAGRESKAAFWLSNFMGRFIHIEYTAVRNPEGEYLGVVEVTQDISHLRALEGDQRLLSYEKK